MNRTAIKNFAIWARRSLREQVRARATQFGIRSNEIQEAQEVSGGLVVAGQVLNADEAKQYRLLRSRLQDLMQLYKQAQAVDVLIDEIAYTWFNRLAALRFMEVNGYLTTRVLSSSDPKLVDPDVLRDAGYIAEAGEFPGLDLDQLDEWRSVASRAPNPDEWLYRRLLVAQCEALAAGLPFLFDRTQNYTALFVPTNLLNKDEIVQRLVTDIPEEDWRDSSDSENGVEIIGWLYQFYISERKDEVIGAKSKVAAQDIPAATQLFTPHWIVRYMVENSLGRLWLESHPESGLRSKMPYYLESPAEQPPPNPPILGDFRADLQSPPDLGDLGGKLPLQPQDLTVCDPACGSGHILVYAFDLLFEIYREQGYLERDIPGLILTHNLFGLDIDERAVQLASFAVLMKARSKNSRILRKPPMLNLVTVRSTRHLASQLAASQLATIAPSVSPTALVNHQLVLGEVRSMQLPIGPQQANESRLGELLGGLLTAFEDADHLGSLITPPVFDAAVLYAEVEAMEQTAPVFVELFAALRHVVKQAELLQKQYWVVVANPPYMGNKSLNSTIQKFAEKNYPLSKSDTFAMFVEKIERSTYSNSYIGLLTPFVWMFLSTYEKFRANLLNKFAITSLVQLEYNAFEPACIPVCTFALKKTNNKNQLGTYIKLSEFRGHQNQAPKTLEAIANPNCGYLYHAKATDFAKIPGSPIAYWVSKKIIEIFSSEVSLNEIAEPRVGLDTGNNDQFIRYWMEVCTDKIGFMEKDIEDFLNTGKTYAPHTKGGEFRRWYGNFDYVLKFDRTSFSLLENSGNHLPSRQYYFLEGASWTRISSSLFSIRYTPAGMIFNSACPTIFAEHSKLILCLALLSSKVVTSFISALSPTLNFQAGEVRQIPVSSKVSFEVIDNAELAIDASRQDWDNFETSWDFQSCPLLRDRTIHQLSQTFTTWKTKSEQAFQQLKQLEEQNNRYWIDAYGLQDELTPEVPDEQITIRRADLSRDIKSLISYAIGCMMGRYSLDHPGLIHAGQPFDPSQHTIFPADTDAILPITDQAYFDDDLVSRFIEFIKTAYSETHLRENLDFIANALTLRQDESARDRIRRYFLTEFISDHIQTYKKRPIYWLFTSGAGNSKTVRAFGALIYLHRYTPNTIAQIRTDYVLELQRKLMGEIDRTQKQLNEATTSTAKKAIQRRLKTLRDQDAELATYQAKLQTFADRRIQLDLDDGVAYNYTRFKGLVYEGSDLKMVDLEKKAQWKLDLSKSERSQ